MIEVRKKIGTPIYKQIISAIESAIENSEIKRKEILAVINLVAIVIQNGMHILGVSLPEKM